MELWRVYEVNKQKNFRNTIYIAAVYDSNIYHIVKM